MYMYIISTSFSNELVSEILQWPYLRLWLFTIYTKRLFCQQVGAKSICKQVPSLQRHPTVSTTPSLIKDGHWNWGTIKNVKGIFHSDISVWNFGPSFKTFHSRTCIFFELFSQYFLITKQEVFHPLPAKRKKNTSVLLSSSTKKKHSLKLGRAWKSCGNTCLQLMLPHHFVFSQTCLLTTQQKGQKFKIAG